VTVDGWNRISTQQEGTALTPDLKESLIHDTELELQQLNQVYGLQNKMGKAGCQWRCGRRALEDIEVHWDTAPRQRLRATGTAKR